MIGQVLHMDGMAVPEHVKVQLPIPEISIVRLSLALPPLCCPITNLLSRSIAVAHFVMNSLKVYTAS